MTERYDTLAAHHYAAFRPPLHTRILERVIHPGESFQTGLDVGCGTGHSTIALRRHCAHVIGLDPSQAMLDAAQAHAGITYRPGSGEALGECPGDGFDLVTFAGSLFYAKSESLRRELARVCSPGATILAYDFEIRLEPILTDLRAVPAPSSSRYDHQTNLADWPRFDVESTGVDRVPLHLTAPQLAHVLLSDSNRLDALAQRFPGEDPFAALVARWSEGAQPGPVYADLYFTRHRLRAG